jgi:hypothetical protein
VVEIGRGRVVAELEVVSTFMNVRVAVERVWAGPIPATAFTIERVGASYSIISCDLGILVDQPIESIASRNGPGRHGDRWFGGPKRWRLPQGAVRTVDVVVIGVLDQYGPQMPAPEDQHPIQHLTADGTHPPLRVGIRLWCPHRRGQHLDRLGGKDPVERGGELGIPIANQEPEPADAVVEVP